ncbi:MAG: NAD(P)-binding domain-containing protein [Acidimicrobiia bacterium]
MRAGVVGLGRMGLPMTRGIAEAGIPVTVFDLKPEAVAAAVAVGGVGAESPAAVAAASDVVCIVVLDLAQVEDVLLAPTGSSRARTTGWSCASAARSPTTRWPSSRRVAPHGVALLDAGVAVARSTPRPRVW